MKIFLVFNNFFNFLCLIGLVSCSSASSSSSPPTKPQPALSYVFSLENCTTGVHSYEDNSSENQLAYCQDLAKEDINNFCAHDERLALISRDCSAGENEGAALLHPSPSNAEKILPHLKASGQKYGLPYKNMEIKVLGRPDLNTLVRMQGFWVTNLGDFSFRFEDSDAPPNTDVVIQDFIDCGFSYDGPTCYEGEDKNILSQKMVAINGEEYLMTVFNYSVSYKHQFALFIEAKPEGSLTHAYLYSLGDGTEVPPSLQEVISESAAKCLASISSIDLNAHSINEIFEDVSKTRQKLTLFHIKMSFPQYRESILDSAEVKRSIGEIIANTALEVAESNDASLAVLWLKLHAWILPPPEYQNFLARVQQENPATTRATEAALLQATQGIITPDIQNLYARALNADDLGEQARAFNLARQRIGMSEKILLSLINTLNHPNVHSAAIAYDILAAQPLHDAYVEPLNNLAGKLGNNGSTYVFAYDLLKKINTALAQNAIIARLSHHDRSIRYKVYQTVDEILQREDKANFTNAATPAAALQMESLDEKSRFYAIQILDHINSPDANLALIQFADQDSFYLRTYITNKVLGKPDKIFTNLHLEALTHNLDPKFPDQVLDPTLKYLFRLGTPDALDVLLRYFNRKKNTYLDDETRRKWILEDLRSATITEQNSYELGVGINSKHTDVAQAFVRHLIHLKHFKSTEVLVENLRTHPDQMIFHLDTVLSELKNRAETDLRGLYDGDAGLNLGDLFMKSRYELNKLINSKKSTEPNIAALIDYYRENLGFSINTLLPIRTYSALKPLVILMSIDDEVLRHKIIAAVLDFDIMPREIWKSFWFHVKPRGSFCDHKIDSGCPEIREEKIEFFISALSPYPETRAAAFHALAWLYRNTKDQRNTTEIRNHHDEILENLYSNLTASFISAYFTQGKEFIPILYAETKEFFKMIIEEEGPILGEQFKFDAFTSSVLPSKGCDITSYRYDDLYLYYVGSLEFLKMLPSSPKILPILIDFINKCPTFMTDYPELGQGIVDVIDYLEQRSLQEN